MKKINFNAIPLAGMILLTITISTPAISMANATTLPKSNIGALFKDGAALKSYQQVKYGSKDYFVLKQSKASCALATEVAYDKPYTILGGTYLRLSHAKNFVQTGAASWYGPDFHGKLTANGETYNMYDMTAAHKTLPMGTRVEVINLDNNKKVVVRINDRGPFKDGRIIDLTKVAANKIGMLGAGTANVMIKTVGTPSYVVNAYHPLLASINDADESFCSGGVIMAESTDLNKGAIPSKNLIAQNTITKEAVTGTGGVVEYNPAAIVPIVATAPVATTPVSTTPVSSEPVSTLPVASEPVATTPVASAPVATLPVVPAPVASEPVATEPVATAPVATLPVVPAPVVPEDEVLPMSEPMAVVDSAEANSSMAIAPVSIAPMAIEVPVEQSTSVDGSSSWKSYSGDVSGKYGIQLGSFSQLANAIKLADVVDGSKVVDIWVDDTIYSRVIIDGFATRSEAKSSLKVIKKDYPKAFVVSLQ